MPLQRAQVGAQWDERAEIGNLCFVSGLLFGNLLLHVPPLTSPYAVQQCFATAVYPEPVRKFAVVRGVEDR